MCGDVVNRDIFIGALAEEFEAEFEQLGFSFISLKALSWALSHLFVHLVFIGLVRLSRNRYGIVSRFMVEKKTLVLP